MKVKKYLSDKCSDVFKHVKREEVERSHNFSLTRYEGKEYHEIKKVPLTHLGLLIQRDIFLCHKQGLMPYVDCRVRVVKDEIGQLNVKVVVNRSSEKLFKEGTKSLNEFGVLVDLRIKQIVWKYNKQEIEIHNNQILRDLSFLELSISHSNELYSENTNTLIENVLEHLKPELLEAV